MTHSPCGVFKHPFLTLRDSQRPKPRAWSLAGVCHRCHLHCTQTQVESTGGRGFGWYQGLPFLMTANTSPFSPTRTSPVLLATSSLGYRGDYRVLGKQYRPCPAPVVRVVPTESTVISRVPSSLQGHQIVFSDTQDDIRSGRGVVRGRGQKKQGWGTHGIPSSPGT